MAILGEPGSGRWVHAKCHPDIEVAAAALWEPEPTVRAAPPKVRRPRQPAKQARARKAKPAPRVPSDVVLAYTDGACTGNPGPGGWAWVVADGRQGSGSEADTTNQRMEISAALGAVRALPGPLLIVSDSKYVVDCFRDEWWRRWRNNGWVTTGKKPVKNRDLWEPLVELVASRGDVQFDWVKGHSGDPLNELADQLAVAASMNGQAVQQPVPASVSRPDARRQLPVGKMATRDAQYRAALGLDPVSSGAAARGQDARLPSEIGTGASAGGSRGGRGARQRGKGRRS